VMQGLNATTPLQATTDHVEHVGNVEARMNGIG